jgi:hypothetical protein
MEQNKTIEHPEAALYALHADQLLAQAQETQG